MKQILKQQSEYFDFPVSVEDLHPFRCGGGEDYTLTVVPRGVGENAPMLAINIFNNKLRTFVDALRKEVEEIASAKGMTEIPIMPPDVATGMRQF